jgi:hypothetical protein
VHIIISKVAFDVDELELESDARRTFFNCLESLLLPLSFFFFLFFFGVKITTVLPLALTNLFDRILNTFLTSQGQLIKIKNLDDNIGSLSVKLKREDLKETSDVRDICKHTTKTKLVMELKDLFT